MPRRNDPPSSKGPTISKQEGLKRLGQLLQRGEQLLAAGPLKEGQKSVWSEACLQVIRDTYGEGSNYQSTFIGLMRAVIYSAGGSQHDHNAAQRDAETIKKRCEVLKTLLEQITLEIGFETPPAENNATSFWDDIHPQILRVAKPRFESQQFADAVEAALKEVNAMIKDHVKRRTGEELDGASLMLKAFSPNAPLITLEDLATDTGKNIQQGYMQIYAGAMTGIRNPKAHANISIDANRARHHLYLASLLAYRFDERQ